MIRIIAQIHHLERLRLDAAGLWGICREAEGA